MTEHKNDWQLCLDIMIERKLKNEEAVRTVVQRILKMLDYKDIKMMQSIGVLGGNYPTLTQMIIDAIADQLSDSDSPAPSNVVVAAMICLMSFNQVEMVSALLKKYIRIINIEEVVFYAQENLNDYGKDIIRLLKPATQQRFIQSLVKTNRYEAVYNIFLNVPSCRDLASVGLICFAHDDDVVNWLRIVRLEKHLNNSELEKAEQLGMQYPYPKEYKNNISTLFQLITIASNAILHGASPYISLIDHRISFLLCYIVSEQCGKIYNKLINGNGFTITSLVEFSYHWKRIAQQRKFSLFNGFVFSIPVLNNAIILLETGLVFSHAMIYIIYGRFLYELRSLGMEFRNSLLTDFSSYTFGTVYIIHYLLIFSLIAILNHLIHKFLSYNKNSIILSYIISGACAAYYISNTYNLLFRITMILCVICTAFFETLKHRNNYPSLKRPQFNRVISFLST